MVVQGRDPAGRGGSSYKRNGPAYWISPHAHVLCVECHVTPGTTLPFIKKKAMEALQVKYATSEEAGRKIPAAIRDCYGLAQSETLQSRSGDVDMVANGRTTTQDCAAYHEIVAVSEASPEVLKTLGLQERSPVFKRNDESIRTSGGRS